MGTVIEMSCHQREDGKFFALAKLRNMRLKERGDFMGMVTHEACSIKDTEEAAMADARLLLLLSNLPRRLPDTCRVNPPG